MIMPISVSELNPLHFLLWQWLNSRNADHLDQFQFEYQINLLRINLSLTMDVHYYNDKFKDAPIEIYDVYQKCMQLQEVL